MPDLLSEQSLRRAADAIALLQDAAQTVATAESLTAGLCCAALTTVAGSSAVVRGGLIVYATDLKGSLAGVSQDVLERWGPVSEPTARRLARAGSERTNSDWAVALTGVAGPAWQDGHPPGTVWIAVHGRLDGAGTTTELLRCTGNRDQVRDEAVGAGLRMLAARLREQSPHGVR